MSHNVYRPPDDLLKLAPDLQDRSAEQVSLVDHAIDGVPRRISTSVTFTPFASAQPCSARCRFCSETLIPNDYTQFNRCCNQTHTNHTQECT